MKPLSFLVPCVWGAVAALSPLTYAKAAPVAAKAAAAAPAPSLSQEEVGRRAITGILREWPIDSLKPYFEEGAFEALTKENLDGFRGQIAWLPRFIGDSMVVFMTGTEIPDSAGRTAFFREYRFANESSKRAPLMLVHLYFADSTAPRILGAYNKVFDDDTRNRIADAQVWETPAGKIDVHSISYMEFPSGLLPIVRVFDEDTTELDSVRATEKASPVAREAIARGFLDQIQKAKPGAKLIPRFGVSLLRRDPHRGYTQIPIALFPSSYGGKEDTAFAPASRPAGAKAVKPTPAKAKSPVKKTKK